MARLDQMDPRWIVEDRADGHNVNSWHWSEKDISVEARKLFARWISKRVIYKEDEVVLRLLDIRKEVEGDSTALNHRGKQGVFFDFDVTVEWQGEVQDRFGYQSCDAHGTLTFNVDQNTVDSFDVTTELSSLKMNGVDGLMILLKKHGIPALRGLVQGFFTELRTKYDPRVATEQAKLQNDARKAAAEKEMQEDLRRLEEEKAFIEEAEQWKRAEEEKEKEKEKKAKTQIFKAVEKKKENETKKTDVEANADKEKEKEKEKKQDKDKTKECHETKETEKVTKTETKKPCRTDEELMAYLMS